MTAYVLRMIDRIRLRKIGNFEYLNPRPILVALRELEYEVAASSLPHNVKTLRKNTLRRECENRDAVIFAHATSQWLGIPVLVALEEDEDFDFVLHWQVDDMNHFCCVQHKEVVPESLNPTASVQGIVEALRGYADLSDTTVAIKLNRVGRFDPASVKVPDDVKVRDIWIYGALNPEQSEWAMWGNFAAGLVTTGQRFAYPTS